MVSKLIYVASYEAENDFEFSLRQAFQLLEPKLRPPFCLKIPDPQEYLELNRAILYGILCEPVFAKTHIKHLHAIVTDGYGLIVYLLRKVVHELYVKLIDSAKSQIFWVIEEMIDVCAVGVDGVLLSMLRQIVGGDFGEGNLWLCFELVSLFLNKWSCLLEELPEVIPSALYTFLRLLADHCRLSGPKLESLKQLEVEFCIKVIREEFNFCLKIGRDFIRLLQDLVYVPEFRAVWKDLLLEPSNFRTPAFLDISKVYYTRTPSRYFLLRISPEMEAQLRFLMTNVKLGSQNRYQVWFAKKFLHGSERETVICDIVRFICCAHHPPNEVIQSPIIPRWAVIGWLLKCCRKHYIEANAKLALFYDWLFFDDRTDKIMNIEPAMLLMVYSIPRYIDMVHTLLEFLFLLVDNYDVERKDKITLAVSSAFTALTEKGVISSLDTLTSFDGLSPLLRDRLRIISSGRKVQFPKELELYGGPDHSVKPLSSSSKSCAETGMIYPESQPSCIVANGNDTSVGASVPILVDVSSSHHSVVTDVQQCDNVEILVKNLGDVTRKSSKMGLKILEELLALFLSLYDNERASSSISTEILSSRIVNTYELSGYKLFSSVELLPNNPSYDDEIGSATALIIRTFIFHQEKNMHELLLFCLRNAFPVGARLLSYVSRLAYEANKAGFTGNEVIENSDGGEIDSKTQLLLFHLNGYFSFRSGMRENPQDTIVSFSEIDKMLIANLVRNAFSAYRCFLAYSKDTFSKDADISLTKVFYLDLMSCVEWNARRVKFLFRCVFDYLSDLCICKDEIVKLLVTLLDYTDLVNMQFEIIEKKFSVFGKDAESIFLLVKSSLNWGHLEQHKLWGLIRSELIVSKFQLESLVWKLFFSDILDASLHAIAIEGLLNLCCYNTPSPELVGAIMLLPNDPFQGFSAAVLASWVVSNESMLFQSLADFAEKLSKMSESEIVVNHSAVLWLVNYYNARGLSYSTIHSNLFGKIVGGNEK
ncbi:integrator complex subunit 3 [Momordica charantia]|uniref:Integrator complex subunit 3 n=1 Tax=Momordica charantia TaxID=3673 RepID=A0A6J1D4A9_MOMCH|nr:integrator complex subunit 3 [Momordica charantia]XP_022148925.1 integrator complex subunit 3 [Momordica charantia]XP_022148926.1 integrator complex subunit 3 [Momordica charantia]XP_022148927.1 integrator complex subunit 3 [Momordica charantia]XP_022148928.1 integrator complex subunit 3 [Momordica charantia]